MSSVHEKLKALEDQKSALLKEAKASALGQAEAAIRELNELGFLYRLSEGAGKAKAERQGKADAPKRQSKNQPCPICHYLTVPPHDGRSHRSQAHKKPFTSEELGTKGLKKVD
jgi:hypothetical protein